MNKTEAETYLLTGMRYLRDEDDKRAIDFFYSAIDTNPNLAEAYQFRGIAHYSLKEYQAALDDSTLLFPWILH